VCRWVYAGEVFERLSGSVVSLPAAADSTDPSAGHDQTDRNQATARPYRTPLTCNGTTLTTTNEHTRMGHGEAPTCITV
jgi:hypothetical protein